ncbi:DUF2332 family protein [Tropicimonas sp. TH_r6]|uniref:DUF2332 domain-containing protein n=1 Tax=Tropicimonas sp. TH_r6 TaxID=3082085 RepID=UPI0029540C99|nr:DUF2332 family protein [Tropicimonas sp. TH_r6]MDV7141978.1 DUF2332 family protein [Tropicimonas sp. TH_r6]
MKRAEAVRASFAEQAPTMERLGSPFMARLMRLLAARLASGTPVTDRVLSWPGDPRAGADNLSMRLAGGLHALVISGAAPELAAVYPPQEVDDETLWRAVSAAFESRSEQIFPWLDRPPQTNEIRRAAAVIPAMHLVAGATGLPLALWEIGCSAGLTLRAEAFRLDAEAVSFGPPEADLRLAPDWQGLPPVPAALDVIERRGVDLAPMDPVDPVHRLRLLSYLWADQPDRRALTEAAISLAARLPARLDRSDALDWLAEWLPQRPRGAVTFLFHTIAWQYLPPEARARGEALIAAEGARATREAPLARFSMEADGGTDAALTLQLWPGEICLPLGRADFHGRAVTWTAEPGCLDGTVPTP